MNQTFIYWFHYCSIINTFLNNALVDEITWAYLLKYGMSGPEIAFNLFKLTLKWLKSALLTNTERTKTDMIVHDRTRNMYCTSSTVLHFLHLQNPSDDPFSLELHFVSGKCTYAGRQADSCITINEMCQNDFFTENGETGLIKSPWAWM